MGWVLRKITVFLEIHKSTGKLNEALIKAAVGVVALQPEVFQNIVGLVICSSVKTREKCAVLGRKSRWSISLPVCQPTLDAVIFFHSPQSQNFITFRCLKIQCTEPVVLRRRERSPLIFCCSRKGPAVGRAIFLRKFRSHGGAGACAKRFFGRSQRPL